MSPAMDAVWLLIASVYSSFSPILNDDRFSITRREDKFRPSSVVSIERRRRLRVSGKVSERSPNIEGLV
jgi:hypothetical protein